MDFLAWLQIAFICLMGAMSPGPSLTIIVENTVSGGRIQGCLAAIGHGVGITLYAFGAVTGLILIIINKPDLIYIINILGACFLLWLGLRLFKKSLYTNNTLNSKAGSKKSRGFIEGFSIAILNPKVAAFFVALFSQYLKPDASWFEQSIMVITVGAIDTIWYLFIAVLLTQTKAIKWLKINSQLFDRIMGTMLLLLAGGLIFRINLVN